MTFVTVVTDWASHAVGTCTRSVASDMACSSALHTEHRQIPAQACAADRSAHTPLPDWHCAPIGHGVHTGTPPSPGRGMYVSTGQCVAAA
eukprot:890301-Rhodomonas_salina.2